MNKNIKRNVIATIAIVITFTMGGCSSSSASTKNQAKSSDTVAVEKKASASPSANFSVTKAKEELKKAETNFSGEKENYQKLTDKSSADDRQKAFNKLQIAYNDLTKAQDAYLKVADESEVKNIEKVKAENKKIVEDAQKEATKTQNKSESSEKKETAAKPSEKPKATAKATPKPANKAATSAKKNTPKPTAKQNSAPVKPATKSTAKAVANNKPAGNTQKTASKQKCHVVNHPAVTHQEPVYGTQKVQTGTKTVVDKPAWDETVVDQEAWDEQVVTGSVHVCNKCGQRFNTDAAFMAHADTENGPGAGSEHVEPVYSTVHHDAVTHVVHHDAVTHQEPVYETKQVQTGTRTVTDKAAWSENVCN